ncbi:MAG: hypothetical protein CL878_14810 [Dehalococcoidia bacterium]|nr:hypothetical protein [Dehalococcoidia bacterium]
MAVIESDVVVAGGGIGGLTAALTAQQAGAQVVLLEKAPQIGGSAAASGGTVWCAADLASWLSEHPNGDPALAQAQLDGFREGIEWLRQQGVPAVEQPPASPYRFERVVYALSPDAAWAMDALAERLTEGGGSILTDTALRDIRLTARGAVGSVRALGPDGFVDVTAPAVILATGGFQGSPELRARYMGRWSDRMVLRAQAQSTGDGLLAALGAGAATAGPFSRFYGHMMPAPPAVVGLHNFAEVKPDFSEWAIFVNLRGERFDDEFLGDAVTVHAAIHQDEAIVFLIFDDAIRSTYAAKAGVTRLQSIRQAGGEIAEEPSLEALAAAMATYWGVRQDRLLATLQGYNAAAGAGDPGALSIPKSGGLLPIETPPFYAIRCLPGITFTYGGARVNERAEVINTAGQPIMGLYAAGADAGGVYTRGYTGGLSLGLGFGRIAGKEAAACATTQDQHPDS